MQRGRGWDHVQGRTEGGVRRGGIARRGGNHVGASMRRTVGGSDARGHGRGGGRGARPAALAAKGATTDATTDVAGRGARPVAAAPATSAKERGGRERWRTPDPWLVDSGKGRRRLGQGRPTTEIGEADSWEGDGVGRETNLALYHVGNPNLGLGDVLKDMS